MVLCILIMCISSWNLIYIFRPLLAIMHKGLSERRNYEMGRSSKPPGEQQYYY